MRRGVFAVAIAQVLPSQSMLHTSRLTDRPMLLKLIRQGT